MVPVQRIGKLTLNRNPENFFAETEQVAFHPGHLVPGIDFTDDPLLQGRLFSYTDTQLTRLGGPNFAQIPINRPTCPMHNNQRDGHMQQVINRGETSYHPNTIGGGCPVQAKESAGGFVSFPEQMNGVKVRGKSEKFFDHFSQAALFFNSQSETEQQHIIDALTFELGLVKRPAIVERMLGLLAKIDTRLANGIAQGLGVKVPTSVAGRLNMNVGADAGKETESKPARKTVSKSPALSMAHTAKDSIKTRKIAFLAANGVDGVDLSAMNKALTNEGAIVQVVAPRGGMLASVKGDAIPIDFSLLNAASVLFDAIYIPGGKRSVDALKGDAKAVHFVNEAFNHCKAIAASGDGVELFRASFLSAASTNGGKQPATPEGVILGDGSGAGKLVKSFIQAIAQHRHWSREKGAQMPA
jgi:catalase